MKNQSRITTDPNVMRGKPVIAGTRITVEIILKKMAEGADINALLDMYPFLKPEDLLAVFEYAAGVIANDLPIDSAA
jgi:uncharacterized protein (DUF433 family)